MSQFNNYKAFWNDKASSAVGAMIAVDGSTEESVIQATGAYSVKRICAALEVQTTDRMLELGCGVARIGRELAPHCAHWHGVDIADNMISEARRRLHDRSNTALDVLQRTNLAPIGDASIDKAYCVAVFIHMDKEDFVLYLREMFRVLKPGGRFFFDTWNLAHPVGWKRFAYEVAQHIDGDFSQRKDVARNQFCTPQEVEIYAKQAGFEIAVLLSSSPQIQVVAVKPGGDSAAVVGARLQSRIPEFAYNERWTELFDRLLHVIYDAEHPGKLYADLLAQQDDEENQMYRAWLRGFWKLGEDRWGPCPVA